MSNFQPLEVVDHGSECFNIIISDFAGLKLNIYLSKTHLKLWVAGNVQKK